MRKTVASVLIVFFFVQGLAGAVNIKTFWDGSTEHVAMLVGPNYAEYINISVPADRQIVTAVMDVSSLLADSETSGVIEGVQVLLNESVLWEFNGTDYGALGRQDSFAYHAKELRIEFPPSGGNQTSVIRLMKTATVLNATMEAICSGPGGIVPTYAYNGTGFRYYFGSSLSSAGDINGDGYDDVIVGARGYTELGHPIGRAYIHFGRQRMNKTADINLTGDAKFAYFGCSVSGAGDVNNDGYDDVIVGAYECNHSLDLPSRAYIYFGGQKMDNIPDVNLSGAWTEDNFGFSVSGAGDVNKDGFDDVIVGAKENGSTKGAAYIFYGGSIMDSTADINLSGENVQDSFGGSVSGAGDVNGDGFDDVLVGAIFNDAGGNAAGRAYIFYGGKNMDANSDLSFTGGAAGDYMGFSVSGAGDVNGDSYYDVIIGAQKANNGGSAYVFYGGAAMDSIADVIMKKAVGAAGAFGNCVSGAGDINRDGYDDVVVGAPDGDSFPGDAYIFFGGTPMDNSADEVFSGKNNGDSFGAVVSGAGDIDKDGFDDLLIGAHTYDPGVENAGAFYIYTHGTGGILSPNITIAGQEIWKQISYFNGNDSVLNFASVLGDYLRTSAASDTDTYGNSFVDVPIKVAARGEGNISIGKLNITYTYKTTILDFADELNDYVSAHISEKDASGNLTVPIKISSRSPGRIKLLNLNIGFDEGPKLVQRLPDVELKEDSMKADLLDLSQYFKDDNDPANFLKFGVRTVTNGSYVNVSIALNKYISGNALQGSLNDNWTGEIRAIACCTNTRNQTRDSNEFIIRVVNVNDPPIFTSTPLTTAIAGEVYIYHVAVEDGDNDILTYNLTKKPQNMTVDPSSGRINWIPTKGGGYEVTIEVTDGVAKNIQNYIIVVPNRPPRITNTSVPDAYVGMQYIYDVPAVDDDGNELNYGLLSTIPGMTIDKSSGRIIWIPTQMGDFPISVRISDGKNTIIYNFTIAVLMGNRIPEFTSSPILQAFVGISYSYEVMATDENRDALSFSIINGPPGMSINATNGRLFWIPASNGSVPVKIRVSDCKGGEAFQEFSLKVLERIKAQVEITNPPEGRRIGGKFSINGNAIKGTLSIMKVQLRIDSGDWNDATGNSSWIYQLDTSKLKNGKHTLQARAFDGMEYSDVVNRTTTVDNQNQAGKGFIPGFAGPFLVWAIISGLFVHWRNKRNQKARI